MIPIHKMWLVQIEVTNACNLICANCTRFVGHHKKPFFMDLETIERAIDSLEDFPGGIGLMGGEPTLHPQFREICEMFQKKIPDRCKRGLWTNGFKWDEFKDLINETFDTDQITYNDHKDAKEGVHQPLLVAIDEVIDDRDLMFKIIDNCWVQQRWSASITPKGAFFCEVAAAQDLLFDGDGGYPIEKGWWKKSPQDFKDQVERYCTKCSGSLPMERPSAHEDWDMISPGNAKRLEEVSSPRYLKEHYKIADIDAIKQYVGPVVVPGSEPGSFLTHPQWTPWDHRTYVLRGPEDHLDLIKLFKKNVRAARFAVKDKMIAFKNRDELSKLKDHKSVSK